MCYRKYTLTFSYRTGHSCEVLMDLLFSRQTFEKKIITKLSVRTDGRTDRHTYIHEDVNSNFSQFYGGK